MEPTRIALADYIQRLSESAAHTGHSDDRTLYQMYLADAAVLLALTVKYGESGKLQARIEQHERLRSQTFLAGPEHSAIEESWQKFKRTL